MSRELLVASNRGPVAFEDRDGELVPRRGSGGLVTALTGVVQETGGVWVASAMSDADRRRAALSPDGRVEVVFEQEKYDLRLLSFEERTYQAFYNTISNRLLWFLHHYLWDVPRWPQFGVRVREAWAAYRQVNRAFAATLAEEADGEAATVLVQDYHLSLVPSALRAGAPQTRIAYFHHVPFAGPGYMRLVPGWLREELLDGLLGADLIGFQTRRWADDFLFAARMLPEAKVDLRRREITWNDRTIRVGIFPITVDAEGMREQAASSSVAQRRRELEEWRGDRKLLLRVDRAELSKNILRGFVAFEDLLVRHPRWRERVVFLAHLNPSRTAVPEYRTYMEQCTDEAERINREHGTQSWKPIELDMGDDFDKVLAAYQLYDALLVNPIFDGMNLVAKEGALLNENDGALILSRNSGAIVELDRGALAIDPLDITGTADAIQHALGMEGRERKQRAQTLRKAAEARTPAHWIEEQLEALGAG